MTAVSDIGEVSITTCVGNAGMGTSGADVTAMSDVGDVAVRTGVGEMGTGTSTSNVTVMSGVSEERTGKKKKKKELVM